jgi:DNA primase
MAFPPGFLDELRGRVSLADLVGRRVKLTRRGREFAGLCPFHHEKTPSFYVVEDKNFFHCFGCGAHGDAIGFVMRADNLDFLEAVEKLAGEAGLAVPQASPEERERAQRQKTLLEALEAAAAFYEARLGEPDGRPAREYLRERGLDADTIRRFRLGWAPDRAQNGDRQALRRALAGDFPEPLLVEAGLLHRPDGGAPFDYFRGRIMFPIGDRAGRVIAFGARALGDGQPKYLNSPDTPVFDKGRVLYGWSAARAARLERSDPIVTEGYMDVIALHRAGFTTAVAPLGTALTEFQIQELWRLGPEPILCFDGDAAGQRATVRALRRALPLLRPGQSLRFVTLPPEEDPDLFVRKRGRVALEDLFKYPRPLWEKIWKEEFEAKPTDTPERRADLRTRLKNITDTITDRVVRSEYWGFLAEKFYEAVRCSRINRRKSWSDGVAHIGNIPPPLPASPGATQRTILLKRLIELPNEISGRVEEITMLDIPEPDLDKLRWEILEVVDIYPDLDSPGIRAELGRNGLGETVGALAARLTRHGLSASRDGHDPSVIKAEIDQVLGLLLLRSAELEKDIASASRAFEVNPTNENWERLRALIESARERLESVSAAL